MEDIEAAEARGELLRGSSEPGIQFADLPKNRTKPTALWRGHIRVSSCWI